MGFLALPPQDAAQYLGKQYPAEFDTTSPGLNHRVPANPTNTNNDSNESTTEQTPVMEISSDRKILTAAPVAYAPLPALLRSMQTDGTDHSIRDFLARPRMLSTFPWTTTSGAGTSLFNIELPRDIITDRVYAAKVAGFAYMRATIVVRVMINTQRFQAGRLLLTWMPLYRQNQTKFNDTQFLVYYTQRPKVEFDVSTDTEVIMKIPYVHPALGFDLGSGFNSAGRLDAVVYSPLTSGTCRANLYYSFENVELSHANEPGTFIAQSGGVSSSKGRSRAKADPGDKEQADMGVAPVSSMLSAIATTAAIGRDIPLISSVAGPVSWAAGLAAKAAHAFGYAKPLQLAPRMRVYEQGDSHRINADGAHMAVNLGVFEDNKVSHLPGFAGSDLDEMAISAVISNFAYYNSYSWNTSQAEMTNVIGNFALRAGLAPPAVRTLTVAGSATPVSDLLPFSYVAQMFGYYRGSIKVKIKIVKTEFHSGRLRFNYRLVSESTGSNVPANYSANVQTTIFDLRDATEFETVVPFASNIPYMYKEETYARFNLQVETPLQAIGDVSSTVDVILELAAGDDFEYAAPVPIAVTPTTTAFTFYEAQSGGSATQSVEDREQPNDTPGSASFHNDQHISAELCIGEKVLSFRQLTKRMTRCMKLVLNVTPAAGNTSGVPEFLFSPYSMPLPNSISPATGSISRRTIWWQPDYITYIGCLYAMFRGSMRVSVRENMGATSSFLGIFAPSWQTFTKSVVGNDEASLISLQPSRAFYGSQTPEENTVGTKFDTSYEDVQVPYYAKTHSSISPIGPWLTGDQSSYNDSPGPQMSFVPTVLVNVGGGARLPTAEYPANKALSYRWVYRAAGEDFSMGLFTGTYPVCAINGTTGAVGRNVA